MKYEDTGDVRAVMGADADEMIEAIRRDFEAEVYNWLATFRNTPQPATIGAIQRGIVNGDYRKLEVL